VEPILDWGIQVILWLQQYSSPALDSFFKGVTFLGDEEFIFLLLPILYWLVDRTMGLHLSLLLALSAYFNSLTKAIVDQPRPFVYDTRVPALIEATEDGFPSGHTQISVVLWGYLAQHFRRAWLWIAAGLLILLVPLSRIYLGVHFPTDLLGGYVIGALLLGLFLWIAPRLSAWLTRLRPWQQVGLITLSAALLILLYPQRNGISNAGSLLGLGYGILLERRWIRFDVAGSGQQKTLRLVVGLVTAAAAYFGLRVAFAALEPALLFRFVRYALISLWIVTGAPWLFVKTGLAPTEDGAS